MSVKNSPRVLMILPLPPPWAGVEQIGKMLVESRLKDKFSISIIKSNVRQTNADKGFVNVGGIFRVCIISIQIAWNLLLFRPHIVYLPISQNTTGLLRDILFISVCMLSRVPIVGHFHGSLLHLFLGNLPCWKFNFYLFFLKRISKWIVVANSIKKNLAPYIPLEKVVVVYNACPPGEKGPFEKGKRDPHYLRISFMGHLSHAKGFTDLLSVVEQLLNKNGKIIFQFAGEFLREEKNILGLNGSNQVKSEHSRFQELKSRFPAQIDYVGIVSGKKKEAFLKNSDIFVYPSYAESFGLAVFEAMQKGIPVVVTPVGALPEVLENEKNGIFVKVGDKNALLGALIKLLKDPAKRVMIGKNNAKLAAQFTSERMVESITKVLQSCLDRDKHLK